MNTLGSIRKDMDHFRYLNKGVNQINYCIGIGQEYFAILVFVCLFVLTQHIIPSKCMEMVSFTKIHRCMCVHFHFSAFWKKAFPPKLTYFLDPCLLLTPWRIFVCFIIWMGLFYSFSFSTLYPIRGRLWTCSFCLCRFSSGEAEAKRAHLYILL